MHTSWLLTLHAPSQLFAQITGSEHTSNYTVCTDLGDSHSMFIHKNPGLSIETRRFNEQWRPFYCQPHAQTTVQRTKGLPSFFAWHVHYVDGFSRFGYIMDSNAKCRLGGYVFMDYSSGVVFSFSWLFLSFSCSRDSSCCGWYGGWSWRLRCDKHIDTPRATTVTCCWAVMWSGCTSCSALSQACDLTDRFSPPPQAMTIHDITLSTWVERFCLKSFRPNQNWQYFVVLGRSKMIMIFKLKSITI
jgi:hypothetical protein